MTRTSLESKREGIRDATSIPNVVKLDEFPSFEDFLAAVAQAVLQYGYARVWSVRHPNDVYLAVHAPLTDLARSNLKTEYDRIVDFLEGGEVSE